MTATDPRTGQTTASSSLHVVVRPPRGSVALFSRADGAARRPAPGGPVARLAAVAERSPVVALALTIAVFVPLRLAWPEAVARLGPIILVAGLLAGLPHGAADVERAGSGLPRTRRALLGLAYAASAAVTFALWWVDRTAVLILLLALAVAHFGDGDVAVAAWSRPIRSCRHLPTPGPLRRATTRLAFGGIPVVVPFAIWPGRTAPLLDALAPGHAGAVTFAAMAALPLVGVAATAVTVAAVRDRDRWTVAALALLTLLFLAVTPLIAFGVYFASWHALRQTCQQLAVDGNDPTGPGRPGRTLRGRTLAWTRRAAAPTAVTLAVLVVLTWLTGLHLPATYLALLLSVTVPHSVVDAWQARVRPVLSRSPA